jgi:hypothetical protein
MKKLLSLLVYSVCVIYSASAQAQQNSQKEVVRPVVLYQLTSGRYEETDPRYETPTLAWAAHQRYLIYVNSDPQSSQITNVAGFSPCPDISLHAGAQSYYWGVPAKWCHDYQKVSKSSGQLVSSPKW